MRKVPGAPPALWREGLGKSKGPSAKPPEPSRRDVGGVVNLDLDAGGRILGLEVVVSRGKFRELLVAGQGGGHGQASALPVGADHVRDL